MKPPRDFKGAEPGVKRHLDQVAKVLSNISFGSSTTTTPPAAGSSIPLLDGDQNMDGHRIMATSPAAPNTEFAVPHSLGRVPMGMIFMGGSNPGVVYRSATPWTATQIFLKETQGTNTFILFIT